MSSYCRVSENPIVSNNQKGDKIWERVLEMYDQARANNPNLGAERTLESLRNRFRRFNTNVTKWISVYKEAYKRKTSRMSNKDVENETQALYGKSKFTHHEVFEHVMRHSPRWELNLEGGCSRKHPDERKHPDDNNIEEDQGSSKKSRTDKDGSNPNELTPISRPIGRDKAKGKRKGKATSSQSSSIRDEFTEELRAMRIMRVEESETAKRKIDAATLNTLLNNRHLTPEEDDLKRCLMAKVMVCLHSHVTLQSDGVFQRDGVFAE